MYISDGIYRCSAATTHQQLVPLGPRDAVVSSMYISEWDLHGAATTTCSHKGEIYTQDMASMYISDRDPQPVHKGEIYQGHGIPPCIYQNGIYTVPRTTSLYKGRNTPRDMAFLHVYQSEWDLPAACTREKYTPRDMAFLRIYQNGRAH
jgi:hypothetical protein